MQLKKNDKYIVLGLVAVIVISAIGIMMYDSPEPVVDPIGDANDPETTSYEVESETKTADMPSEEFQIKKGLILKKGSSSEILSLDDVDNIKDVTITVEYNDNIKLLFLWNDKLDITVTDPSGKQTETQQIKGSGNVTFEFNAVNSKILTDDIEADDQSAAMDILETRYKDDWARGDFTIDASINGKGLFERLAKDKFTVSISYSYYVYDLSEIIDEDDTVPTGSNGGDGGDDSDEGIAHLGLIISAGAGRF